MAGTVLALHHRVQRGITELARVRLGINLLHRRGESDGGTVLFEQGAIGLQRTRILQQIIFVIELRGVDKHADHRHVILFHTAVHQRGVPCMEGAHRGDQTNTFTFGPQGRQLGLQGCDCMYYFHCD